MNEKLGTKFLTNSFEESDSSFQSKTKVIALYFGASWSKACNAFRGKLLEFYTEVNKSSADQKNLEVVYVNFDQTESAFKSNFIEMPWLALPFKDNQRIKLYFELKEDIEGIPAVLIMKPDGNIASKNGRADIEKFIAGTNKSCFENWLKIVGI